MAKKLFIYLLILPLAFLLLAELLQSNTLQETQIPKVQVDSTSYDGFVVLSGRRVVKWKGAFIPKDIQKSQDGFFENEQGCFITKSYPSKNETTLYFKILSRKFEIENEFTRDLKRKFPFENASFHDKSLGDSVDFLGKTIYVKKHPSKTPLFLKSLLLFAVIIFGVLLFKALAINRSILAPPLLILTWLTYSKAFPDVGLENLGYIFQPISYASSDWIMSYADLLIILLLINALVFTLKKKWQLLLGIPPLALFVAYKVPSLLKDGELYPSVNLPFTLQLDGILFWCAFSLMLLPLAIILNRLFKVNWVKPKGLILYSAVVITLHTTICDLWSMVDLIHVWWPIIPLILALHFNRKPVLYLGLLLIGLGATHSVAKYANHKIIMEGKNLAERLIENNETALSHYLLQEEWVKNRNEVDWLTDTLATEKFISDKLLISYLDKYQANLIPESYPLGIHRKSDSLIIGFNQTSYLLQEKDYVVKRGFPGLLADESWQIQGNEKLEYAFYKNGRLKEKTALIEAPEKGNFAEHSRIENYPHRIEISSDDYTKAVCAIPLIKGKSQVLVLMGILAVLLSIQLVIIDVPSQLRVGFKFRNRIRISLMGICIITALLLAFMGYKNLRQQFEDENTNFLQESCQVAHNLLQQSSSEIWSGQLLLVDELERALFDISATQNSDYSFYQINGELAASSEPLLYKNGFRSYKMPYDVLSEIQQTGRTLILRENIGSLNYLSAYMPFYDNKGFLLGIINIPLFEKQEVFNKELQTYSASYFNVLVITLALALMLSHFLSNSLGQSISRVEKALLKEDKSQEFTRLDYEKDDEIGALVNAYNEKVDRLKELAEQIAEKERESAWKHMAQQVAHEIKNPLTPLKLKAQWLQMKLGELNEAEAKEKSKDLIATILDQTELLKNIANEFSRYASLTKSDPEKIELSQELKAISALYNNHEEVDISIDVPSETQVYQDKSHFKRIFTNLIKNAVQAKPENRAIAISIHVISTQNAVVIKVQDNGVGIAAENLEKIFQPNFTTKTSGTGLGLAMVKNMLQLAGAEINVISKLNKGTTFTLTYPNNKL